MPPKPIEGVDLLWVLQSGFLIFLMAAGFALLETGSVRQKHSQTIFLKITMALVFSGFMWWACGYALAYGDLEEIGLFGTTSFFCNEFERKDYAQWFYTWIFAAISGVVVSGSLTERV